MKKNLRGNNLKAYKKDLKLTQLQCEILFGTLLGDASMPRRFKNQDTTVCFVKFEQSIKNKDYIKHLYEVFEPWVGTPPSIRVILGGNSQARESIGFRTYSHPSFLFYYLQFYDKVSGKKKIPELFSKNLTDRSLAYWYMDDGSYNPSNKNYYINTQSFLYVDLILVQQVFLSMYGIQTSLHKDKENYRIYIKAESAKKFVDIIKPYILPCFFYKFNTEHIL